MEQLRVLIADDHPLFRNGLRALLGTDRDTVVVGEAASGDEAVTLAAELQPDVLGRSPEDRRAGRPRSRIRPRRQMEGLGS